jgi:hypothetical protein
MRYFVLAFLTSLVVACTTKPEAASAIPGVTRVSIPAGCYSNETDRDWNVRLSGEFESTLLGLINEDAIGSHCWREKRDGRLLLTIDDECGPHREAVFERVAGVWTLVGTQDVPVVLCDVRRK